MSDEQHLILSMLQDGKITPEDANRLLAALESGDSPGDITPTADAGGDTFTVSPVAASPDMQHFRRYWEYPFFVGMVLVGITGLCVANTGSTLLLICGWTGLVAAALVMLIGWVSQYSPWMHVRVREADGSRVAFSLPVPLRLADPLFALVRPVVRRYTDRDTSQNFDMIVSLVSVMGSTPGDEPISIEVDEDDGDHVQVFFG